VVQGGVAPPPGQEQHVQPHQAIVLQHDGQEDGGGGAIDAPYLHLRPEARLEMCHQVSIIPHFFREILQ
jgi:hypothetical protein